jgi:hypothetical protein
MRPLPSHAFALFFLLCGLSNRAPAADKLYLGDRFGQVVMEIDVATGDRTVFELEDYPEILTARFPVVEGAESFLFWSFDAIQRQAIRRYHIPTGVHSGISGYTDIDSQDPRGAGPDLNLAMTDSVLTPAGTLLCLQVNKGPMEIDLKTGDRHLLASEVAPVTGADPPLLAALDVVWESTEAVLVADRFQGIFSIARASGEVKMAFPTTVFTSPPYNIERLPDGRILHCLSEGDPTVYLFDPRSGEDRILSAGGPFPIGEGEPFVSVWDIALDSTGRLYVHDIGIPAVFEVNVGNGNRRMVSGENRGEGPPLLADFNMPSLSAGIAAGGWVSYWLVK